MRLYSPQSYFIQERDKNNNNKASLRLDTNGSFFKFTSGKTLTFKCSKHTIALPRDTNKQRKKSDFISTLTSGKLHMTNAQVELLK